MENESLTHYMRVAVSLAERIAAGELREGEKLSGRSKLSPEYNVSPETVRRALRLLTDMKVVEVKEQSGVYILSADNARRYLHLCAGRNDLQEKQRRLRRLLLADRLGQPVAGVVQVRLSSQLLLCLTAQGLGVELRLFNSRLHFPDTGFILAVAAVEARQLLLHALAAQAQAVQ